MATETEVLKVWTALVASYPNYARDNVPAMLQQTLRIYQRLLADVPGDVLDAAAMQHIASCKWFPTVAELRTGATALATPGYVSAIEAWGEVLNAIGRWNRYSDNGNMPLPEFSNPIIGRIVRSMGMVSLQDSTNEVADRARFIEAYETLVRRDREETMMLPVAREKRAELEAKRNGAPQLTNGKNGDVQGVGAIAARILPPRPNGRA